MSSTDSKPNAATQAKKRWNAKHYTAIKVYADPDVAAAFKAVCAASGESMNGRLTQLIAEYCSSTKKHKQKPDYSTRRQRRTAIKYYAQQIGQIRDAEEQCRDNTPENLQRSIVYEQADEYVASLDEAVERLESIY